MHYVAATVFPRPSSPLIGWQQGVADAAVQTWLPAIHTLRRSARAPQAAQLERVRHRVLSEPWEHIQPFQDTIPAATLAAPRQLRESFRRQADVPLRYPQHLAPFLTEVLHGVFVDEYDALKQVGIERLGQSFRRGVQPGVQPVHRATVGFSGLQAVMDAAVPFSIPSLDQLRYSFQTPRRPRIDPVRMLRSEQQQEWLWTHLDSDLALWRAAIQAFQQSFRRRTAADLALRRHLGTRDDAAAWQAALATPFDPAVWAALHWEVQSFRRREGPALERERLLALARYEPAAWQEVLFPAVPFDPAVWAALCTLRESFRRQAGASLRYPQHLAPFLAAVLANTPAPLAPDVVPGLLVVLGVGA